jgi:hypothetical protein
MYWKIGLYLIINLLAFKLGGFWLGLIALCIVIYKLLDMFGIIRNIIFYRGSFADGIVFTKDYYGSYNNLQEAFNEAKKLISTYQLKDFLIIGIYYDKADSPDQNKLRSSIGIYKPNRGFPDKVPEEFERYCQNNEYNKNELPNSNSLYASWEYFNTFTLINGIRKFKSLLYSKLKDPSFKRLFKVDENKVKVIVEVYKEKEVNFYVPLLNVDKFMLFKKDK